MKAYKGETFSWIMLSESLDIRRNGNPIVHHLPILDMYDKELSELQYVSSAIVEIIDNDKKYSYNAIRIPNKKETNEIPNSTEPEE